MISGPVRDVGRRPHRVAGVAGPPGDHVQGAVGVAVHHAGAPLPVSADYEERLRSLGPERRRGDMVDLYLTTAVRISAEFVAKTPQVSGKTQEAVASAGGRGAAERRAEDVGRASSTMSMRCRLGPDVFVSRVLNSFKTCRHAPYRLELVPGSNARRYEQGLQCPQRPIGGPRGSPHGE